MLRSGSGLPAAGRWRLRLALAGLAGLAAAALGGCGLTAVSPGPTIRVAAAENVWGSIAAQLGGDRVSVTSVVSSPAIDPHAYEPTTADARVFAMAQLVIVNGLGYDPWAAQLVAANPVSGRAVVDAGAVTGHHAGDNPHRWYYAADVSRVIDAISAQYAALDPGGAAYFEQRKQDYVTASLATYHRLIAEISARYGGVPVGASENIAAGLAESTGLRIVTPPGYMDAVAEGSDPGAGDRATAERQISDHAIRVFLFNSQNATPDVQTLVADAHSAGIPVVAITETMTLAAATFQDWQGAQLQQLLDALATAAAR